MITGINLAVSVPVDYDRAAAVLRSDVLCWLRPPSPGAPLRFEGRLASRRPLARRVTVAAIRQLLHEVATRMPTAPITAEDDSGARAVSVVRCPVVRPL